ncbi:MAG: hypothetical protein QM346_18385 [Chloroflexota bacterium]|jgi:hypothetical protein|nr:hypothetical protein [Chloroflexota bacterium]
MKEPDKVRHIVRRLDDELSGTLFLDSEQRPVGRIYTMRRGFGSEYGRPDVLVMVELELNVLGTRVKVQTPILVEAEDAGLNAAWDDWDLFLERDTLHIPMVVVGKPDARRDTANWTGKARISGDVRFVAMPDISTGNDDAANR